MDSNSTPKNDLADKLKSANNILVTVSRNPSVDQLSALLGLTLLLNKQGKHTAAVFSGEVPSTLEFLKPDDTFEKNTDSLRDFIIALDKSKADKLRYKVEDNVVRIFITPFKTSISEADLEFSQGDFNVDVVVALGVQKQEDLDEAITAHGRILHDATVTSINISAEGGLGSINWQDAQASSLSELVTELAPALGENLLDEQIATALLTGIVAETHRFSNEKTTSLTMSASATLMAAGANQQLVATKLDEDHRGPSDKDDNGSGDTANKPDKPPKSDDGTLAIDHEAKEDDQKSADKQSDKSKDSSDKKDDYFQLPPPKDNQESEEQAPKDGGVSEGPKLITEPPKLGGQLTANTDPEGLDPSSDPLSATGEDKPSLMSRDKPIATLAPLPGPADEQSEPKPTEPAVAEPPVAEVIPTPSPQPAPFQWPPAPAVPADDPLKLASEQGVEDDKHTLSELEESVHAEHADKAEEIDAVRNQVNQALNSSAAPLPSQPPIQALNAQTMADNLHAPTPSPTTVPTPDPAPLPPAPTPTDSGLPAVAVSADGTLSSAPFPAAALPDSTPAPAQPADSATPQVIDSTAPPPVPPPMFPVGNQLPKQP